MNDVPTTNDGPPGLPGPASPGGRLQRVVATLRTWARVDRTTSITGLAVALRLREQFGGTVPLRRTDDEGAPDVVVDGSIGVLVLDGREDDPVPAPDRLPGLEHLVVYANAAAGVCRDAWERLGSTLSVAELGLSSVAFVGDPEPR